MINPEIIAAFTGLATVIIWLFYLNIFWHEHQRNRRPFLLIHHATAQDPEASCMIVNMSKEAVHIQCVIVTLEQAKGYSRHYLTGYSRINPQEEVSQPSLREGPLMPGGYIILGTFTDLLLGRDIGLEKDQHKDRLRQFPDIRQLKNIKSMEICVAVTHGQTANPIGARRAFFVEKHNNEIKIRSYSIYTEQLIKRKKRKIVKEWVEQRLEPKLRGDNQNEQTLQTQGETSRDK
ncbi:MAG: hypothetical protein ACLFS0_05740 [Bacteroidales bacterium]